MSFLLSFVLRHRGDPAGSEVQKESHLCKLLLLHYSRCKMKTYAQRDILFRPKELHCQGPRSAEAHIAVLAGNALQLLPCAILYHLCSWFIAPTQQMSPCLFTASASAGPSPSSGPPSACSTLLRRGSRGPAKPCAYVKPQLTVSCLIWSSRYGRYQARRWRWRDQ